jgi:hypothetical protein
MNSEKYLDDSKDSLLNRTAFVVSCGPSLSNWKKVLSTIEEEAPYIVCVKQSINEVGSICDLHVFNVFNIEKYSYPSASVVRVLGSTSSPPPIFAPFDVSYVVDTPTDKKSGFTNSTAYDFDPHTFDLGRTGLDNRPWGPGVMYEFVLPYLLWCGVSKIVTVGWDVADKKGQNSHFYDSYLNVTPIFRALANIGSKVIVGILKKNKSTHFLLNWILHVLGKRYNKAAMQEGEASVVASSIPLIKVWLESQGVD